MRKQNFVWSSPPLKRNNTKNTSERDVNSHSLSFSVNTLISGDVHYLWTDPISGGDVDGVVSLGVVSVVGDPLPYGCSTSLICREEPVVEHLVSYKNSATVVLKLKRFGEKLESSHAIKWAHRRRRINPFWSSKR